MKPFLSFCVVLLLFQSLISGVLVKLDVPDNIPDTMQETIIHKHVMLDAFLVPEKATVQLNLLGKNDWIPVCLFNKNLNKNASVISPNGDFSFYPVERLNYCSIPVFIRNGALRI